jgi:acyl-CoA synthetase (AMP-forming)/AMP-acid ligase II
VAQEVNPPVEPSVTLLKRSGGLRSRRVLQDDLYHNAALYPDKPAVISGGVSHTYSELQQAALRFAAALNQRGINRGDRVAIYNRNTWECCVSIYGSQIAGGVLVVINPQTKTDKLKHIIEDSDATLLVSEAALAKFFLPAIASNTNVSNVICAGAAKLIARTSTAACPAEIEDFDVVLTKTSARDANADVIPVDLAALIYTSGSTGFPKGVMQTHQSMLFAVESIAEYLRLSADDRILNVLPLAFDYGLYQLLMAIHMGATLVLELGFTYPAKVINTVIENDVTVFPAVPTIFTMLLSMHAKTGLNLPSVRRVTNTAAALPGHFIPTIQKIFPNALIFKMYGLTECKRVSYLEPELLGTKSASVGKAIPGTEVFLRSPQGDPVAVGDEGILHVRGPHVMLGYWKNPEKSKRMLKPGKFPGDRVLCTQDWFRIDEEGFLYFCSRSDDIIKTRGEKVSPTEVENVLSRIEGVREVAVVGVADDLLGQSIAAFLALEKNATLSPQDVISFCASRLESFMVPSSVVFLAELPKTPSGKISKKSLPIEPGS